MKTEDLLDAFIQAYSRGDYLHCNLCGEVRRKSEYLKHVKDHIDEGLKNKKSGKRIKS